MNEPTFWAKVHGDHYVVVIVPGAGGRLEFYVNKQWLLRNRPQPSTIYRQTGYKMDRR